jgi:hypothetical protein
MATLYRESRWRIAVYGREHGAPHFHVEGPGWRCSIAIDSLELIVGEAPKRDLAAALAWAAPRRAELLATWRALNP